ncbi:MAG: MATE family efflux transporter [Lachnospiraceae bacterium]|nr:MATE family efflux transporter [Lachnospiraceae bacterium]
MKKTWKEKFIGDRAFYKMVLLVAVPIMIQNGITNFVNLLDNIMVGQIGTEQMSGVAIVNQLMFVYNLCIFGGLSGAGIFTAQYYGQKNEEGIRNTFRFKIWMAVLITVLATAVFLLGGTELISLYLNDSSSGDLASTLLYGKQYLMVMLLGLPGFMLVQIYSSTLRECGETVVPMAAGVVAVFTNLIGNYLLIFGKFGFPQLGVAGAAIATSLSRYVEAVIVIIWTHYNKEKNAYIIGLYRTLKLPVSLTKEIILKGTPLLLNETFWSMGMAALTQCYSIRGLSVVAAVNISSTIGNLFNVSFIAMGSAVAIIMGQLLGAGKLEEARDTNNKLIMFTILLCIGIAICMALFAPVFPQFYNTEESTKQLAAGFIMLQALFIPQQGFLNAAYFTLRSGGKTMITFFFDSVFICCISVPIAFVLSRFTTLPVLLIFALVQAGDWIKCVIGFILVKKGVWIQNIIKK